MFPMKWLPNLLKGLLLTAVLFLFSSCFEDKADKDKEAGPYIDQGDNPASVETAPASETLFIEALLLGQPEAERGE